jgi:hypothetical protein
MSSSSLILLFIWLIIYFFRLNDKKEIKPTPIIHEPKNQDTEPTEVPFKGDFKRKEINYFSNNRLVNEPHLFYYFNMLSLQDCTEINDETIEYAAVERYALINKVDDVNNWPIASRDIHAAKEYLLDRWAYMTHLN